MNRIRDLREDADLKQTELAEKIGISQKSLSRYEREETEIDGKTAKKLADYFNVSLEYLLGYSNKKTNDNFTEGMEEEDIKELEKYKELLKIKRQIEKNKKISTSINEN